METADGVTADDVVRAEEALGREVESCELANALTRWQQLRDDQLRNELARRETAFKAAGGRGVLLADEIDEIRMVLAVRCR